jgi:hypothetical protein
MADLWPTVWHANGKTTSRELSASRAPDPTITKLAVHEKALEFSKYMVMPTKPYFTKVARYLIARMSFTARQKAPSRIGQNASGAALENQYRVRPSIS